MWYYFFRTIRKQRCVISNKFLVEILRIKFREEIKMTDYTKVGNLRVATQLYEFINSEALPGTNVEKTQFWAGFENIIRDLTPKNRALLAQRDDLQNKINQWHRENKEIDFHKYKAFLQEIGYLEPEVEDFKITTENVDDEIAIQAGPQLVVPVNNDRYALNAANARWGSLYDALYGSDVISEENGAHREGGYNPIRGEKVIAFAKAFLDQAVPLQEGSHKDAVEYRINDQKLVITLSNGKETGLSQPEKFAGFQGDTASAFCYFD